MFFLCEEGRGKKRNAITGSNLVIFFFLLFLLDNFGCYGFADLLITKSVRKVRYDMNRGCLSISRCCFLREVENKGGKYGKLMCVLCFYI